MPSFSAPSTRRMLTIAPVPSSALPKLTSSPALQLRGPRRRIERHHVGAAEQLDLVLLVPGRRVDVGVRRAQPHRAGTPWRAAAVRRAAPARARPASTEPSAPRLRSSAAQWAEARPPPIEEELDLGAQAIAAPLPLLLLGRAEELLELAPLDRDRARPAPRRPVRARCPGPGRSPCRRAAPRSAGCPRASRGRRPGGR